MTSPPPPHHCSTPRQGYHFKPGDAGDAAALLARACALRRSVSTSELLRAVAAAEAGAGAVPAGEGGGVPPGEACGAATCDGSGVATCDDSGVATCNGSGVATCDGSGAAASAPLAPTALARFPPDDDGAYARSTPDLLGAPALRLLLAARGLAARRSWAASVATALGAYREALVANAVADVALGALPLSPQLARVMGRRRAPHHRLLGAGAPGRHSEEGQAAWRGWWKRIAR